MLLFILYGHKRKFVIVYLCNKATILIVLVAFLVLSTLRIMLLLAVTG